MARGFDVTARTRKHNETRWGRRTAPAVFALAGTFVLSGCSHRWVTDYTVRKNEVVFAVQDGSEYQLADCKRQPDGRLTDCRLYEMELD